MGAAFGEGNLQISPSGKTILSPSTKIENSHVYSSSFNGSTRRFTHMKVQGNFYFKEDDPIPFAQW